MEAFSDGVVAIIIGTSPLAPSARACHSQGQWGVARRHAGAAGAAGRQHGVHGPPVGSARKGETTAGTSFPGVSPFRRIMTRVFGQGRDLRQGGVPE